jgi:hypothetical protein
MTMAKKSAAAQRAQAATVVKFDLAAWAAELNAAALSFESGAKRLLELALAARGKVEHDTAREKFQDAFAAALAVTHGVTDEEARKSKSFANRVSDAMAILKAAKLPGTMPNNLQRAADAVRKENRDLNKTRKPRAGGKVGEKANAVETALGVLDNALLQLVTACADNAAAVDLLGDLKDMANDLREALLGEDVQVDAAA